MSRFLTIEEVCERYRLVSADGRPNVTAVHKLTRADAIPFLKRRGFRRLLFDVEHLDLWDAGCALEAVTLPDCSKLVRPCDAECLPGFRPILRRAYAESH